MKSVILAFSMYSKLPMPRVEWDEKSLAWALCAFPLVGVAIGAALAGWLWLWDRLALGWLGAAGAVALPIALSGGIHMDGFCDTCDALASRQSRERKLEILKDSRTGAFAVLGCALYLLVFCAAWAETDREGALVLALSPVLSRCLSALAAVSWRNARGSGLLAAFTAPIRARRAKALLLCCSAAVMAAMALVRAPEGGAAVLAAALVMLYYRVVSHRQFGGVTGDTAGYFLQLCELAQALAVVLAQKVWVLLCC